jgi:parvulin-like peptidyl-prolyl isomerase
VISLQNRRFREAATRSGPALAGGLLVALAAAHQALLSAILLLVPAAAGAEPVYIDGIVAQVGDELVLASEVEEQVAILSLQANLPDSSVAEAREEVLRRIIDEKIMVQEARARGITVADEDVEQAVDRHMELIRQQMGGEEAFRRRRTRRSLPR